MRLKRYLRGFEKNVPRGGEALDEKRRKAEWRLQTERLSRDEEKQLVSVIKDLETKLKAWKKLTLRGRRDLSSSGR